ncbi:MAG: putative peptide zinc metalloprotease protein [Mariniblastus sp.]|jgi:putative peptide zinc metalloprotease protein
MMFEQFNPPQISTPESATENSTPSAPELRLRMRKDLICQSRGIAGLPQFVIKDPVRMTYHCYQDEDFFLLNCLDGVSPFSKIRAEFKSKYGSELSELHFQYLISAVIRDGLVLMNIPDQGKSLYQKREQPITKSLKALRNPLAIKFPGFDLSRVFDAMVPFTAWIINPYVLVGVATSALMAMLLVLFNLAEFQQKLPLANEFFAASNIVYLLLVLGITKIFHEFGHALTCRHLGAECHQVGLMFLVFTPCLYCDVTDAWMINEKWRRILIASAGVLVELGLASVCTFFWWVSEPGFFNNLCLNVMFVCSLGTVLFNGNPLLRYDGYYVLSDLVDIPNLWTRSRMTLRTFADRILFGLPTTALRRYEWPQLWFMACYAVCSILYRVVIIFGILYFVMSLMKSFHLFQLSLVFAGFVLMGAFITPAIISIRRVFTMVKQNKITRFRATVIYAALGTAVFLIFTFPIPYRISIPAFIELENAERIYVSTPGVIVDSVSPGATVIAGQQIAELDDYRLRTETRVTQGQYEQNQSRLKSLEALRMVDPSYGNRIPTEQENAEELKARLQQLQARVGHLQLRSTRSGTVFAPRDQGNGQSNKYELGMWEGSPMDVENRHAFLEKGTLFCLVGNQSLLEGYALVQQSIVDLVEPGQSVELQIGNSPGRRVSGEITQLSPLDDIELPPDLKTLIVSRFGPDLRINELEFGTMFLASIRLQRSDMPLLNFESATARITLAPRSIGFRLARYLKQTFIFLAD